MSLEQRIQQSVEAALADLRTDLEANVRNMVRQFLTTAEEDQRTAVEAALARATEDAAAETARQVAEVDARARANIDQQIADARNQERDAATESARAAALAEGEQRVQSMLATAQEEMRAALANAEDRSQATLKESVNAALVSEREREVAALSRLLESVRGLDGATTLSEVLDALAQAASREASRAAVLVLRNERLLGWRLLGFGARDSQAKQIDLGIADSGVLSLAVSSARVATTRDQGAAGPEFAELPPDRMGLAVPVIVGGRVVAVLYGDGLSAEGRTPSVPNTWPEVIEILARHAARCLEALTVQKTTQSTGTPRFWVAPGSKSNAPSAESPQPPRPAETQMSRVVDETRVTALEESARRIARLLLSEIRLYHERAVNEGRRSRNLLSRLGPEIERARRVYDERVPATFGTRAELFHQELVSTLAGGDAALLGLPA